MNTRTQTFCACSGLAFVIVATLGWLGFSGMLPPISPTMTGEEVQALIQANTGKTRFGTLVMMFAMALTLPWMALITVQLKRIEGSHSVLAYTQLAAGAATIFALTVPMNLWTVLAFRPDRDPQLMLLINDFSWLMFIMTFPPFFIQLGAIGIAILSDRNTPSIFPRWSGYFNLWVAILFLPGGLVTFFKDGPFAWDGLLAFWMPLAVFLGWYIVMFVVLLGVIRRMPQTATA